MKYLCFSLPSDPTPRVGIIREGHVVDLQALLGQDWKAGFPTTLLDLIQAGRGTWQAISVLIERGLTRGRSEGRYGPDQVRWHAPIPKPRKNIVCLGLNYMSHVKETSRPLNRDGKMPEAPIFFTKAPTTVNGPFDPILWDLRLTEQVDYEAELGVVIGAGGANISRANALDAVFGYTIVNDVSARDLQHRHKQWFKGKSLDGFCPMGPSIVTADEFGDPQSKRIALRLNGETRQNATTGDMIFPVDAVIESLSQGLTLEAGDIIATGTPEGVGLGRTPPEYLKDGDVIETEIEGIGTMRNRVSASFVRSQGS